MTQKTLNKTIMFADVSGSARLFERLEDKDAATAVERCIKRMEHSINGFRGRTLQVAGDELQALFDTPEDACMAAIDMQLRVADLPPISGLKLTIRIGLHCGEIVEQFDTVLGEAVNTTARITGMARVDQILASHRLADNLPSNCLIYVAPLNGVNAIREGKDQIDLVQIDWQRHEEYQRKHSQTESVAPTLDRRKTSERLCLRYRGKAFLLDDKTPTLSLGRDPSSKLLIQDRKASRAHGRVEKRDGNYFYIDSSTNGSFVSFLGQMEVLLRKDEIQLLGSGRICFGSSRNDPLSDFADFEYL
jgi:adenylate cyclase